MTNATPTKLRDGSWGARVTTPVKRGDTIQITTRSGKSWQSTVEDIVYTNDGVTVCRTSSRTSTRRQTTRTRTTRTGCRCGSVEEFSKASDCWACKHDA